VSFFVRPAEPNDMRVVRKHWLASARSGFSYRNMREGDYTRCYGRIIDRLLERSLVLVVANKARRAEVVGFSVTEHPADAVAIVHFCYTKFDWRRRGIARALLTAAGLEAIPSISSTHDNVVSQMIRPRHAFHYNPFLIWPELFEATEASHENRNP
jgi:GNAT superfamily N-acetyltransferase